ncbi:MAG: hypothetical protein RMM17_08990 [Acidobacteriota bacterium]|nr:hypothetical protein [Blastocatellia bacterium]MDW8412802.1 hypothetical protein [Acidobacteriota bacterium]
MFFELFHKHYWGPPRKREDGRYYMTCYECGKSRRVNIDLEDIKEPATNKKVVGKAA